MKNKHLLEKNRKYFDEITELQGKLNIIGLIAFVSMLLNIILLTFFI